MHEWSQVIDKVLWMNGESHQEWVGEQICKSQPRFNLSLCFPQGDSLSHHLVCVITDSQLCEALKKLGFLWITYKQSTSSNSAYVVGHKSALKIGRKSLQAVCGYGVGLVAQIWGVSCRGRYSSYIPYKYQPCKINLFLALGSICKLTFLPMEPPGGYYR